MSVLRHCHDKTNNPKKYHCSICKRCIRSTDLYYIIYNNNKAKNLLGCTDCVKQQQS